MRTREGIEIRRIHTGKKNKMTEIKRELVISEIKLKETSRNQKMESKDMERMKERLRNR